MRAEVSCPYCGERNEIVADPEGGSVQSYVEDCQVCCQPWQVTVTVDRDRKCRVTVRRGDALTDYD